MNPIREKIKSLTYKVRNSESFKKEDLEGVKTKTQLKKQNLKPKNLNKTKTELIHEHPDIPRRNEREQLTHKKMKTHMAKSKTHQKLLKRTKFKTKWTRI